MTPQLLAQEFYSAIAHGDSAHRDWLAEQCETVLAPMIERAIAEAVAEERVACELTADEFDGEIAKAIRNRIRARAG